MNKGTKEGKSEEIYLTKELNKKIDKSLWKMLQIDLNKHFAVHVTTLKYGAVNEKKIWPKADVFIIKSNISNNKLKEKDYYLCEDDLEEISHNLISSSGISVKRRDSKRFQIMKIGVSTFRKLFNNTELGAGASIYCLNPNDIYKNESVLNGWNTDWIRFNAFFNKFVDEKININSNLKTFKKIKKISNLMIKDSIERDTKLSDFIFKGIGNFKEPFTANYIFEENKLKLNYYLPFKITTGSGRSKGIFTIVLKPE